MKRLVSFLLSLALLLGMIPAPVFAAEDPHVAELRFYSDCTVDSYTVISQGSGHNLTYNLGDHPYKFAVKMNEPEKFGYVYITSTVAGVKKTLDAVYNEKTGLFETSGYFDPDDKYYRPNDVRVEYSLKATAPEVGSTVDWTSMVQQMGGDLSNAIVTNENDGGSSTGKVEFVGALADIALNYDIDSVQSETITQLRDYYKTQSGIAAYIVPGLDDTKYYAYLDMTDPNTYRMFLDDGLDVGSKAVELKMDFMDTATGEYAKMMDVSHALSNASTIVGTVGDVHNIVKESNELRDEVNAMYFKDAEDKDAAIDAIDALEEDRIAFALLITAIPIIATGGAAGPAAAAIFTGIIGVMSAASDTIYSKRVGGIKGTAVKANWNSNIQAGELAPGISWQWNKTTKTLSIGGSGEIPYGVWELAWYYNSFKEDGTPRSRGYVYNSARKIVIERGITSISQYAFLNFEKVEELHLPNTLRAIGDSIAPGEVYFHGTVSEWEQVAGYGFVDIYPPPDYKANTDHEVGFIDLTRRNVHFDSNSGNVTKDIQWSFDEQTGTLYFSGSGAFPDYEKWGIQPWRRSIDQVQTVKIGIGITELSENAFAEHDNLESVSFPVGLERIGGYAFYGCVNLEDVILPDSITAIGSHAFDGCKSFRKITIPESVRWIGDWAFSNCVNLETAVVKACEYGVGMSCFAGCKKLKSVTLPDNIKTISRVAFSGCTSLETLDIPESVEFIGYYAFDGCTNLKSIQLPEKVWSIEEYAFRDCTSLTKIEFPAALTELDDSAFAGCTGLKEITFKGDFPEIESDTFENVTATCYYPAGNSSWTSEVLKDYGGTLTWKAYGSSGTTDTTCKHSWQDATCTEPKTCKTCKATEGKALGHEMGEWKVTTEATTSKVGQQTRTCTRTGCKHSETESIGKKPGKPAAKASNVESSGKIKIKWEKVSGAKEYQVYRATSKSGTYKKLTTTTKTSYTDKTATAGKKYYYKVRAVSETGVKSSYSSIISKLCKLAQPEVEVTNTESSGKVKLKWEKVENASKYYVYRASSKDGKYTKVKSTTSTSFTDSDAKVGKKYYYKVKAIYSKDTSANSAYSDIENGTRDLARPDVKVKLSKGDPKLEWKKISGAKEYKIYRATSKDGKYKAIKTTTSLKYTDKSAKAGKTYYYKVKAIHKSSSANSAYSSVDKIKAK